MSIPTITPFDVEQRFRPLSGDEVNQATVLIDDAWTLLRHTISDLDVRLVAATLDGSLVRMVICSMVARVLRNPEGRRQESIEDYSYTVDSTVASGVLTISADDLALLAAPLIVPEGAFTIRPYGAPDLLILP